MSQPKTIVLTGAGSGGHITPLLAIAAELKRLDSHNQLIYIGQTGDPLAEILTRDSNIDAVYSVRAGKFRRYHGEGWSQLLDIPTMFKNIRDAFYVIIGLWQSRRLLKKLQPNTIFIKGGFVGVPIGLAAASLRQHYITHDSDAIPGLANRIVSRWAQLHAVALPADIYPYPVKKTRTTGIPLQATFKPVTGALKQRYRQEIKLSHNAQMLFVIGGGLGSQRVNAAVATIVPHLLDEWPKLEVIHLVGQANLADMTDQYSQLPASQQARLRVMGYVDDVYRYSGAADIIVTRAGATNMAEFSLQGKACIVIPSPFLAGGHQLRNAQYLADQHAAVVLDEAELTNDPNRLAKQVSNLLSHPKLRDELGDKLAGFAQPDATHHLAELIMMSAEGKTP